MKVRVGASGVLGSWLIPSEYGEEEQEGGEGGGGLHFKAWAMAVIKQDSESDGAMLV